MASSGARPKVPEAHSTRGRGRGRRGRGRGRERSWRENEDNITDDSFHRITISGARSGIPPGCSTHARSWREKEETTNQSYRPHYIRNNQTFGHHPIQDRPRNCQRGTRQDMPNNSFNRSGNHSVFPNDFSPRQNWRSSTSQNQQTVYNADRPAINKQFNSPSRVWEGSAQRPHSAAERRTINQERYASEDRNKNPGIPGRGISYEAGRGRGRGRGNVGFEMGRGSGSQRTINRTSNYQKKTIKTLTVQTLMHLSSLTPREIVMQFGAEDSGCEQLLKQQIITEQVQLLLLKALAKACQCTSSQMLLNSLLVMVLNSTYLTKHLQQLMISLLSTTHHDDGNRDSIQTILNEAMVLMHALLQHIPSSCSEVGVLVVLLESLVMQKGKEDESYQDIQTRLSDMKDLYHTLATDESDRVKQSVLKAHYKPPPDDFRKIPLLPEAKELKKDQQPFLRQNLTTGKYVDVNHYLDVQYRLLREDFVAPLREGISQYLEQQNNPDERKHRHRHRHRQRLADLRLYTGVQILNPLVGKDGIGHIIKFDTKPLSRVNWKMSKRLITGSLVCLTKDDFHSVIFAIVEKRDIHELAAGRLMVRFNILTDVIGITPNESFLMAETTAYFEQYRPVLLGLQEMAQQDLYGNTPSIPMEKYIVSVTRKIQLPCYLSDKKTAYYDLRHLTWDQGYHQLSDLPGASQGGDISDGSSPDDIPSDTLPEESDEDSTDMEYQDLQLDSKVVKKIQQIKTAKARWVPLLETGVWPAAETLHLDESQLTAFQTALSREFSLIQGPPGTGKTYVGLKIVQTLLLNRHAWSTIEGDIEGTVDHRPILVVCYTNHALDQFLEGIYEFEKQIIRVGGGSSSEKMKDRNLNELRYQRRKAGGHHRRVFQDHDRLKKVLENAQYRLDLAYSGILTEFTLRPYMEKAHFDSLTATRKQSVKERNVSQTFMTNWLGLTHYALVKQKRNNEEKGRLQMETHNDDGNINVLGEAELIAQLRQMEEEDPVMMADQRARKQAILEQLAFVVGMQLTDEMLTAKPRKNVERIVTSELGRPDDIFPDQDASNVDNVWRVHPRFRWRLYRCWLARYVKAQEKTICQSQHIYQRLSQQQKDFDIEEDEKILKEAKVVGMTTTGAAKNRSLLQHIKPRIIIVEEAAEVLEAHIITTLSDECQHLILIGDHQQLRPNPTVYRLAKQFKLDVSLFERMINNRLPCQQLHLQHRMRPEISILMKRHFYQNLDDHQSILKYKNIRGVCHNMFFIQHNELENEVDDMKSRSNTHEATFLVGLCRYLLQQGYSPSQITILTTYTGQLLNFKSQMDRDTFNGVKVCVVDNYQGEENDIILLSLVRSNEEGDVGFLKVDNRICVALSRAKKGLFCIGNLQLLAEKSKLWRDIMETLTEQQHTGQQLPLVCKNHSHVTNVACDEDFTATPDGGCSRPCEYRLQCGHVCTKSCHLLDPQHKEYICLKPCAQECIRDHPCKLDCKETCKCPEIVDKTMDECGHEQVVHCHQFETWKCKEPCEKELACGHICPEACGKSCISLTECQQPCRKLCIRDHPCKLECKETCKCPEIVDKTMDECGHEQAVPCHQFETWKCKEPCEKELTCGHICPEACGSICLSRHKCRQPCSKSCIRDHSCQQVCKDTCRCNVIVTKIMSECGNEQSMPCREYDSWKCREPCEKTLECGHVCSRECGQVCHLRYYCTEPCEKTLECGHACSRECGQVCYLRYCTDPCEKTLECGHACSRECGQVCLTASCTEKVEITLPDCAHKVTVMCKNNRKTKQSKVSSISMKKYGSEMLRKRIQSLRYPACVERCSKLLPCGHECRNQCIEPCTTECTTQVDTTLKCGHQVTLPCGDVDNAICKSNCEKELPCGHTCHKLCKDPCKCDKLVDKVLPGCGHTKHMKCCVDTKEATCSSICNKTLTCGHLCLESCHLPCQCRTKVEQILPGCGHKVEVKCGTDVQNIICKSPCSKKLSCTHKCKNKCHEACVAKCKVKTEKVSDCGHKKMLECCIDVKDVKCIKKCSKKLQCSHTCQELCHNPCTTQCQAKMKVKMPKCNHSMFIKCHQDKTEVACTAPCKRKLTCGHKCTKTCGEPCETKCEKKKEKTMTSCNHRQTISCYIDVKDHICQVPCKKQLQCRHLCVRLCGETCRCGISKKKKMPKCRHMQMIGCNITTSEHVCQEKCRKMFPCGHACLKRCGEPCPSQCELEKEKTLPGCKHKQVVPCSVHPKDFKCIAKCKQRLSCSHPCHGQCGEPCNEKCTAMLTKVLPDCKHRIKLACSDDITKALCQVKCKRKLKCGHGCKKKCSEKCTEICRNNKCSKTMACGHPCVVSCSEACKCDAECELLLSCGHGCKNQCQEPCTNSCNVKVCKTIEECGHQRKKSMECYEKPTREDCDNICTKLLDCGHRCRHPCKQCEGHYGDIGSGIDGGNILEEHLQPTCLAECDTLLQCGHMCADACRKCIGGRIHGPCKQQCQRTLLCGCKCKRLCVEKCYALSDRYHLYGQDNEHQRMLRLDRRSPCKHSPSSSGCDKPCEKKLSCGHRCIGLCGEPCISLCRYCDRDKVMAIFPEYTVQTDPCYIKLSCNHIIAMQSLTVDLDNSKGYLAVKPINCPKCGKRVKNSRFSGITTEWVSDLKAIKTIIVEKESKILSKGAKIDRILFPTYEKFFKGSIFDRSPQIEAKVWIYEILITQQLLTQRLERLTITSKVEDSYGISTKSELLINNIQKLLQDSIQDTTKVSGLCSDQLLDDFTGEFRRVGCCCELLETLSKDSRNQTCSEEDISTAATKIMKMICLPGGFTVQRYESVQKSLDKLYQGLFGREEKRTRVLISMPAKHRLNPPLFLMGEWFKCRNGHYFCRSECYPSDDGVKLKCPQCDMKEEIQPSATADSVQEIQPSATADSVQEIQPSATANSVQEMEW